jgi:predicted lysophospholipase L1 biosynthesis ABC-type transport system permease subunit
LLAARLFPQGNAIGQHIKFANYLPYFTLEGQVYTVVGVAADVKNAGLAGQDEPEYYELRTNHHAESWDQHHIFILESALPVSVVAPWIRSQVAQLDPTAPAEIGVLSQDVHRLADRPRFETALLGFFAFCGLLMAVIGLYGVIAFLAAQRTQEIGVRMALGATRGNILRLIAGEGVRLILLGGLIGLGASLAMAQWMQSLLFNVGPRDPLSFLMVGTVFALVGLAATLIPARAAMKVEPVVALRYE